MPTTKNNPTIADIAKKAGVSTTTVSRVISNSQKVKPNTKDKVQSVIKELGYVPNYFAQRLAGNESKQIGVIVDELGNFFFTEVVEALQDYFNKQGYSIQIAYSKWDEEKEEEAVKNFISNNVEGIIIAPVNSKTKAIDLMNTRNFPFIAINCILDDDTSTCIVNNNFKGGGIAANYFNERPANQTFILSGWNDQSMIFRKEGFINNYYDRDNIINYADLLGDNKIKDVVELLIKKHDIKNIKTNIFITNDILAIPLVNYLVENEVDIPNTVSIISYDNIYFSRYTRLPLTTIDHGIQQMCSLAASKLIDKINSKIINDKTTYIEPKIIFRETTKK